MTMTLLAGAVLGLVLVGGGLLMFAWLVARQIERQVPARGRFIDIQGNRIHYLEQGSGPQTLLLIHGMGGALNNFTYDLLGSLSGDCRVVAIDRPGSGYSGRAKQADATLATQAEVLAGVIDRLQLGRTLLVGHSLGGAVALATALRHPDKVRGLALLSPLTHMPGSGLPGVFSSLAIRRAWLRRLFAWTLMVPLSIWRRRALQDIVFGPEPVPADFPVKGGGVLGLRPPHFIATSEDLVALEHVLPQLPQGYADLQLPVRILYGRDDAVLDPREQGQAMLGTLPDVQLEMVEGGHMLPLTRPAMVAAFVRRCLSSLSAETSETRPG